MGVLVPVGMLAWLVEDHSGLVRHSDGRDDAPSGFSAAEAE